MCHGKVSLAVCLALSYVGFTISVHHIHPNWAWKRSVNRPQVDSAYLPAGNADSVLVIPEREFV